MAKQLKALDARPMGSVPSTHGSLVACKSSCRGLGHPRTYKHADKTTVHIKHIFKIRKEKKPQATRTSLDSGGTPAKHTWLYQTYPDSFFKTQQTVPMSHF